MTDTPRLIERAFPQAGFADVCAREECAAWAYLAGEAGDGGVSGSLAGDAAAGPEDAGGLQRVLPQLLEIKSQADVPLSFRIRIEVGDRDKKADNEVV